MKIGLCIRGDVDEYPGGDWIHLKQIARALNLFECQAIPILSVADINSSYDTFILFNTTRISETYEYAVCIKEIGIPYFIIPIWHSVSEMKEFQRMRWKTPVFPYWIYAGFRECYYSKRSKKPLHLSYVLAYQRMIREVIGGARAVFPNSHSEWKAIESEAKVGNLKVRVIPCGVDVIKGVALSNRQDVLCIGRVEPRKNQVCIQEAFMECSANNDRLVFVGAVNRAHAGYAAQFEEGCLDTSIQHLGELPHEELMRVLNSAKGLVLGSFFETTGLVVMEALSRGVRVAMTDSPVARELYGESVIFINPYKKESVTVGIREILSEEISRNSWKGHSWEKVSELILQSISEYIA